MLGLGAHEAGCHGGCLAQTAMQTARRPSVISTSGAYSVWLQLTVFDKCFGSG